MYALKLEGSNILHVFSGVISEMAAAIEGVQMLGSGSIGWIGSLEYPKGTEAPRACLKSTIIEGMAKREAEANV